MKDFINLDNIGNPEVLENITNWSEIKNHVKIRNEKGDDGKMYIYLDPQLENLTVGARLAFVREFRGLTQDAVAEYLELEGENRRRTVTRYETNKRVPSEERLKKLRKLYRVNINSIKPYDFGSLEDSIYILLWMEELYPNSFKYFEIVEKYPKDKERVMMRFSDEWKEMREKRINKEITWSEYIEWKLNYHIKED